MRRNAGPSKKQHLVSARLANCKDPACSMTWHFALNVLTEKYLGSAGMQFLQLLGSFAESLRPRAMGYFYESSTAKEPGHQTPAAYSRALFAHENSTELFLLVILPLTVSLVVVHCVFRNVLTSFMLALQFTLAVWGAQHLRAFTERALFHDEF